MSEQDLMIYEHEIPAGSRLYFGKSASLKRRIEYLASKILNDYGFSEMVTPFFSYHQHLSLEARKLIRFSDTINHEISLRADSTQDVVRIALKRLKNNECKKWFYIQPVFHYPSSEIYQIGAEMIALNDLKLAIEILLRLFSEFALSPYLQLSNIQIPRLISKLTGISLDVFEKSQIEQILSKDIAWLSKLALLNSVKQIDMLYKDLPQELKEPLRDLADVASNFDSDKLRLSPLFYSNMRYYDGVFFRFLQDNFVFASGGHYEIEKQTSSGFAVYTDNLIEKLMLKEQI